MRPFLLYIISAIALFSSCNWVNDDLSDCPSGTWLKISYTYNILDVDAASTQVSDITILAFDKDDKYVDRVDVDSITLHQGYCMVRVPFPEGTYRLLIWGGTSNHMYQLPNLKAGQTERRSLNISLACDNKNQSNKKLNALFYTPVGTTPVYYLPYQKEVAVMSEQTPVIHARLNTLRIMKGDQTTLSIKHIPSGQNILRLPLTQYLLLSKIYNDIGEMSDQEYLDRQDSYTLLFFIQPSDTGIPHICPRMQVNGWIIRLNNSELES